MAPKVKKSLETKAQRLYRQLVKVTARSVAQAWEAVLLLKAQASRAAWVLVQTLLQYLPLVQQVIDQTSRRVERGEAVPASEKIVSLFEPHTAIIQRGKARPHETEFGRKVWYCESDGGIITDYRLLRGNPPEAREWLPSLKHQCQLFGHPPEVATADRGVYSPQNEQAAKDLRETCRIAQAGCQES